MKAIKILVPLLNCLPFILLFTLIFYVRDTLTGVIVAFILLSLLFIWKPIVARLMLMDARGYEEIMLTIEFSCPYCCVDQGKKLVAKKQLNYYDVVECKNCHKEYIVRQFGYKVM